MGSDVFEVHETPLHVTPIKVHVDMCTQLLRVVDRISNILPHIEAGRPRCSTGLRALCQLHKEIDKSRTLVQKCCDSSKLYLALTGDALLSRIERTRNQLQQSLNELLNMVPVALGFEMSGILDDLKDAVFFIDAHEDEAGKALRALLQRDTVNSFGTSEIEVLQFAAVRLHLSSKKDFLIEGRSIRKLLDKVEEGNLKKRDTLKYFLYLLKKRHNELVQGQTRNPPAENDAAGLLLKSDKKSVTTNSIKLECSPVCAQDNAQARMLHSCRPPDEFKCPLSSRLMHDPVIISSGETFERTFIQKWFEEGNDTCPRTKVKLANLSLTPNTSMRDLILKWSMKHQPLASFGNDPSKQASTFDSLEASSDSICSTASSMKDIHLQIDFSNLSLGSLDSSHSSGFFLQTKVEKGFSSLRPPDVDFHGFQFFHSVRDIKREFLSNTTGLPWESQCKAVQDVKDYLVRFKSSVTLLSSENFMEPLVQFLKDALDRHDPEAQRDGIELLLFVLKASRMEAAPVGEDLYAILASFTGTEAVAGALAIMEVLSTREGALSKFVTSGALTSIIKYLSGHNKEFNQAVIRVLYNLSSNIDVSSCDLAVEWIPKLVPFLKDASVTGACLGILENLFRFEVGRVAIAETDGCIGSIVDLLETGSCEDQEHAVGILRDLCAQREYYCHLVLHEGVIPPLCRMMNDGNEKGKGSASELLRLLKDVRYEDRTECPRSNSDASVGRPKNLEEKKSSRTSRSLGKKMMMFLRRK